MSKNKRLNASITIGSVLEQSVKKNIGFIKSGLSSVGNEIKDVERKQRELGKQRSVLEKQGRSVEALDREYEDLSRTLDRLRRQQERWNRAAAASRRVGSTFDTMASDMVRNGRTIAIGLGLAGGAVFGLASSTAQLGDDVAKTASKLGIGTAALQELRYAAERSGVSTSAFDGSLEKMTKNIGLALEGTGAQKDALDALGLSADELATMLPEEALGLIADRMQGVATQAEKAAIANAIFGRSGIALLNMLRDGSKGLQDLREDARRTGYALSEQATRDAEVFQDTLLDTKLVLKGLKNTVGTELMPVVTQSMRRIGDALLGNREQVKVWAASFADGVERAIPVIGEIGVGLGKVLSTVGGVTAATADMVGGWENFGIVVGAVLASRTVIRIGKFATSVFSLGKALLALTPALPLVAAGIKAIGAAMIANPIGATITAIAVGATLIITNWGKIKPALDPILTWIADKFATVMKFIQPVIDAFNWTIKNATRIGAALGDVMAGGEPSQGSRGRTQSKGSDSGAAKGGGVGPAGRRPLQTNALGGPFGPGWHLTGEAGPELKFENRSGYVADNRAMRQLATFAERIGRSGAINTNHGQHTMTSRISAAMAGGQAQKVADTAAQVVQNITNHFHASGVSAQELMALAERKRRMQAQGALFDRAPVSGPFGR